MSNPYEPPDTQSQPTPNISTAAWWLRGPTPSSLVFLITLGLPILVGLVVSILASILY